MGYTNFLIWAGKQGFKHGQKYLNKAWQEATKGGKQVLESQFPKLINKAKDYYKNFKGFDPKVVSKTDQLRRQTAIRDLMKDKPRGYKLSEEQIRQYMIGRRTALKYDRETALQSSPWDKNLWGPTRVTRSSPPTGPGQVIPFPKKPPGKAEGGIASLKEGGPSQKEIDKGLKAIEKLKSSLMPESYEELIEIYKDKQKDLNIDIMESAGGLGEMLGEGGRIGMMYGGDPGFAFSYGGSWADWKDNHASEMPLMDYINQKLPKARNPFSDSSYQDGGPVIDKDKYDKALRAGKSPAQAYEEAIKDPLREFVEALSPQTDDKAEGGRIGMAGGMTPSESWMRNFFFGEKGESYENRMSFKQFQMGPGVDLWYKHIGKAKGGRIGFQEGTGIMSQTGIPYYADKAVEGIVNSAETLSKLPFAAGKLGSQLLQSPPDKKMFTDALENITPGSWSKNLGISSLAEAEGAKVSDKQRAIGDVLGLGTEIAVPVGGAFKIGQKIIDQASKAMGKLKKGKTLDQTIDDKITDFGQSRRDFNATVAASGLMVALKGVGLGGLLKGSSKKVEDIRVTYSTGINEPYEWDDVASWAGNYEFESLTAKGVNILKKVFGKDVRTVKDPSGELTAYVDNVDLGEATSWVNDVKKAGGKMELKHVDDYGSIEPVYQSINKKGVKLTEKQEFLNASGIDSGYGLYDDSIDEVYDIIYDKPVKESRRTWGFSRKVKKAEGGIIEDDEFREFLEDKKNRDQDKFQRDFFEDFKKWKKWKDQKVIEAKDGGRMWQPKSAPQLTTTIPPESGPMPQGLTYLTGDDIVQNIGHKHGRN